MTLTSILDLPEEILNEILCWLTDRIVNLNVMKNGQSDQAMFELNQFKYDKEIFNSLLSLSSTCSVFRALLGSVLFGAVSLIRINQVDALLSSPKILERFSDRNIYHRKLIKETLEKGFSECVSSDLARYSFRYAVNGDSRYRSRYQRQFSVNNFVNYLECDNSLLTNWDINMFKNIHTLKVLDLKLPSKTIRGLNSFQNLRTLSINAVTLSKIDASYKIISHLKRLDLYIDFNEMDSNTDLRILNKEIEVSHTGLKEINLFVNDACVITYESSFEFIDGIKRNCKCLESLTLRVSRIKGKQVAKKWSLFDSSFESNLKKLLTILQNIPSLKHIGLDLSFLNFFSWFDEETYSAMDGSHKRAFTIIEGALSTPKLSVRHKEVIKRVVRILNVNEVHFQYGEVIDQSHIQALNLVANLLGYLCSNVHGLPVYSNISLVSLEKCWSVSDDSIRRDYYHGCMYDYANANRGSPESKVLWSKLAKACPSGRLPFNSPRYRQRETFDVIYPLHIETEQNLQPRRRNLSDTPCTAVPFYMNDSSSESLLEYSSSAHFWDVETCLVELEQYGVQRKTSKLWS